MEWRDEGVILAMRKHGESAAIIEVFTAAHGRHAGVVRGGGGRRMAPVLQPGSQVAVDWHARLEDHIGTFLVEPLRSRAALLDDRTGLAALSAICALARTALPEREPHPDLWQATVGMLDGIGVVADWPARYLRWELRLLEDLGFALDLTRCAVTGQRDGLAYVSPRSGRAVSREGAGDWADRLLPLPACLLGQGPASATELMQGLAITGHFLARGLEPVLAGRPLPEARTRLVDLLARTTG
jgi:DNA repair protein RecO (recombination protein O)